MAGVQEDTKEVKASPIIMKVDAPPEDSDPVSGQGDTDNNVPSNEPVRGALFSTVRSRTPVLASPRLNSNNPFSLQAGVLGNSKSGTGSILRPSQLGSKLENKPDAKSQFSLNPSRLNVFAKVDKQASGEDATLTTTASNENNVETPKFVPLVTTEASRGAATTVNTTTTASVTSTPNFIFGHNLHERVIAESENAADGNSSEPVASTSCNNTNGTSEFLFRMAAKSGSSTETTTTAATKEPKSLKDSVREYEESRANKRKYDQVAVVTGEEDEENVLQINCKLFAFDKATGNWKERGRGTLRLNDKTISDEECGNTFVQSRLVIRITGSFRVALNTKIWAEMTVEKPSSKSIRLTAMDSSGQIRVFLIMANPDEVNQLHKLLVNRVNKEVLRQSHQNSCSGGPTCKKPAAERCDP